MQQFQPLRRDLNGQLGYACDIAARPVKAGDKSELNRVASRFEHDRNRRGRRFAASAAGVPVAAITATSR